MARRHVHDSNGGSSEEKEMRIGNQIVTYKRVTCSCGDTRNEITSTRTA